MNWAKEKHPDVAAPAAPQPPGPADSALLWVPPTLPFFFFFRFSFSSLPRLPNHDDLSQWLLTITVSGFPLHRLQWWGQVRARGVLSLCLSASHRKRESPAEL